MKRTWLLGAFAAALAFTSFGAVACDKAKHEKEAATKGTSVQAQSGEKGSTYLTGSYMKQDVRRNGRIMDSGSNVKVYDSKDISRSGQSNVRDFLIQQGATH